MAMKKPSHTQPMQGDSDYTDLRDIITRCAAILKDGTRAFEYMTKKKVIEHEEKYRKGNLKKV